MTSTRAATLVLAGAVGLVGLGVGAALGPGVASAATNPTAAASSAAPSAASSAAPDRVTRIEDALAGLVKDGTLTQAQADEVASTLASALPRGGPGGGHGGHGFGVPGGGGLDTAAGVLGVTTDELRTALRSGQTLAQVAKGKGISQAALVDELVAAAKTRLAAAVTAGRLTQAQADAMTADLPARITQQVTSTRPAGGRGHDGGHDGDGDGPDGTAPASPSASPSSSAPTS